MKKVLLTLAAIALMAGSASAQTFSLWTDLEATDCDVQVFAPYQAFNLYVFLEPDADGAFAVEYKLVGPAGHFVAGVPTPASFVSAATLGSWFGGGGISAGFLSCQNEKVWVVMLPMMSPNTTPGYYMLEPNDSSGFLGVAVCVPPDIRPKRAGTVYNHFGFNDACIVGTEESSWGAIKSIF